MLRPSVLALCLLLTACADEAPENTDAPADVRVLSNETEEALTPSDSEDVEIDTTGSAVVTVAGQTVPRRAVVTAFTPGDRSCYLTLQTDGGGTATVMGDFSLCDTNALLNRRVQLEYAPEMVSAESCQGDPECLETEEVALAVAAVRIPSASDLAP